LSGRGWFGRKATGARLETRVAEAAVTHCRRALGRMHAGLDPAPLQPAALGRADSACEQALEALEYRVNPALVLDWLAAFGRTLAG